MSHVFVTGDIHGDMQIQRLSSKNWSEGKKLTKNDILIITGDFGLLWANDVNSREGRTEQYWMKFLMEKPWTTCFVDGNHENFFRLNNLPVTEKFGGKVGQVNDSVFHLKRGEIYTIHNKTFFCFGGARSRDIYRRELGKTYWTEEVPSYHETMYAVEQLHRVDNKVDFIVTHTAPTSIITSIGMSVDYLDPTSNFLEFIKNNIQFEKWYCGHLHLHKIISKYVVLWDEILQII